MHRPSRTHHHSANYYEDPYPPYPDPHYPPQPYLTHHPAQTLILSSQYTPRPHHRSPTPLSKPHSYLPTNPPLPFDKALSRLSTSLQQTLTILSPLREEFVTETSQIQRYAGVGIIDQLWGARVRYTETSPDDEHNAHESGGAKSLSTALTSLSAAITASTTAVPSTSSTGKYANVPEARDKAGMQRSIAKLRTMGPECVRLMKRVRSEFGALEALMEELEFVRGVVGKWGVFTGEGRGGDGGYDESQGGMDGEEQHQHHDED